MNINLLSIIAADDNSPIHEVLSPIGEVRRLTSFVFSMPEPLNDRIFGGCLTKLFSTAPIRLFL